MPSFDVVSRLEMQEIDNAVSNAMKEITQRYDFKGSISKLERSDNVITLFNVSAEFADSLDHRPLADRARSAVFSSIPDAVLVSGAITGEAAKLEDLESVKKALPQTPVLANTGVTHNTVEKVFNIADGCIIGSALKVDGNTWNPVDPDRAKSFMELVNKIR